MKRATSTADNRPAILDTETGEVTPVDRTNVQAIAILWKTPYNHDTLAEAERTGTVNTEPSLTKQEFKEETDINNILARFARTGDLPAAVRPEDFQDISEKKTFLEIQSAMAEATQQFYKLPPDIRARANNNPAIWADQVMEAMADNDAKKLTRLGLEVKPPEEAPPAPPTPPTPPKPAEKQGGED